MIANFNKLLNTSLFLFFIEGLTLINQSQKRNLSIVLAIFFILLFCSNYFYLTFNTYGYFKFIIKYILKFFFSF